MQLGIRARINIVFGVALLWLAGFGWLSYGESRKLDASYQWVAHTQSVLSTSARLRSHLMETVAARHAYVTDESTQGVDRYSKASVAVLSDFADLRQLTQDNPNQEQNLAIIEPLLHARLDLLRESIDLRQKSREDDHVAQQELSDKGQEVGLRYSVALAEFEKYENDLLRQRTEAVAVSGRREFRGNLILGAISLGLLSLALWFINRELIGRRNVEKLLAERERLLQSVLDTISDPVVVVDNNVRYVLRNPAAAIGDDALLNALPLSEIPKAIGIYGEDSQTLLKAEELPTYRAAHGESFDGVEIFMRRPGEKTGRWNIASGRPLVDEHGKTQGGVVVLRDITERVRNDMERERWIAEISDAIGKVRTLSGMLPICASCKKIRDDKGYWQQIESYIHAHSEASFSHGICPECAHKLYPEVFQKQKISGGIS